MSSVCWTVHSLATYISPLLKFVLCSHIHTFVHVWIRVSWNFVPLQPVCVFSIYLYERLSHKLVLFVYIVWIVWVHELNERVWMWEWVFARDLAELTVLSIKIAKLTAIKVTWVHTNTLKEFVELVAFKSHTWRSVLCIYVKITFFRAPQWVTFNILVFDTNNSIIRIITRMRRNGTETAEKNATSYSIVLLSPRWFSIIIFATDHIIALQSLATL